LLRPKLESIENRLQATRVHDDDDGSDADGRELQKQGKWLESNHDDDMELVTGSQESDVLSNTESCDRVGSNKPKPVLHSELYGLAQSPNVAERVKNAVEAQLKTSSTIRHDTIRRLLYTFIASSYTSLIVSTMLYEWSEAPVLSTHLSSVRVAECSHASSSVVALDSVQMQLHVYQVADTLDEEFSVDPDDSEEEHVYGGKGARDITVAASVAELPNAKFEGLWDNLVFEEDIKGKLMRYIYSAVEFGERDIDFNIISWNRCVTERLPSHITLMFRRPDSDHRPESHSFMGHRGQEKLRYVELLRKSLPSAFPIGQRYFKFASALF
jgi:hypothetical protein